MPITRNFAPFVAGMYSISLFIFVGYFFGNLPFISKNFTVIIYLIIVISVLPAIIEAIKQKYFLKLN